MKGAFFFLFVLILSSGCGLREREKEVEKKLAYINEKEQELLLKEQSLRLIEEELAQKRKSLDSSARNPSDSFIAQHPELPGKWDVNMRCTETNCSGSAVGDTKNEQWEISYQNGSVVAQAFSGNKLVRVYSGKATGNTLELSTAPDVLDPSSTTMIVRIEEIKGNEMDGQRDIIRTDNCRIVYTLDFKKLQP